MRPPHYTGENFPCWRQQSLPVRASMRPPHYTGENVRVARQRRRRHLCFNEAPALHGGKPLAQLTCAF